MTTENLDITKNADDQIQDSRNSMAARNSENQEKVLPTDSSNNDNNNKR